MAITRKSIKILRHIKLVRGPKRVIYITLTLAFLCGLLETIGLPHSITYLFDVLTVILLAQVLLNANSRLILTHNSVVLLQLVLFIFGTLVAIFQGVSPILTLWSIRNNVKYIIFFAACVAFFDENDIEKIYSFFTVFELLNLLLAFYQKFVLNIGGDNLGGIFGTNDGCNGILNCYLVIMFIHHFVRWMQKVENVFPLALSTAISLTIAVLSELKFYFVEVAIIFIIYAVWISIKEHRLIKLFKLAIILTLVLVGISFAIQSLVKIYPQWEDFFSIKNIIYQSIKSEGYTGHGDINRLSGIFTINSKVFRNNYLLRIFGMGLGSTELAEGKAILTSEFFLNHINLHYNYFSLLWMYLETGVIGLLLYLGSFISILITCIRQRKDKYRMTITTSIFLLGCMVILFLIYNQSMRTPAAYIVYAYLSILYIRRNNLN